MNTSPRPENLVRGGSNSENVFFFVVDKGREDQNITKSGPSWAFRRRADDDPTLNIKCWRVCIFRGSGPVLLRNPIFSVIFQWGGGGGRGGGSGDTFAATV